MIDTVLLKSGDIYLKPSSGGSSSPLPLGSKPWLNDQIIDMCQAIKKLETEIAPDGRDGRDVALKVDIFPPGAPDTPDNYAVLWRLVTRPGEVEDTWKPLVWRKDLVGPEGPTGASGEPGTKGDKGDPGTSVKFSGSVAVASDLIKQTHAIKGDGYIVTSTNDLWVLSGDSPLVMKNWINVGKITGPKGDKGDKGATGPRGSTGPKGDAGGISAFLTQWIVDTATNQAISYVMMDVNSMINDAMETMANQLANMAEDAAEAAVNKAIEDMMDEFKGEKGDKGDKGEDGKNGTSFNLVGKYDTVAAFQLSWPAVEENVGVAAMIGPDVDPQKHLWSITKSSSIGIPTYGYKDMGVIAGPKGEDATWNVSIRDKDFVETINIEVESDLPGGVAGMFIQETDSILVEGLSGSIADPNQVGFRMKMKYPIPTLVADDATIGTPTKDKVLSNDGHVLKWVEGGSGGSSAKDQILLKGADSRIWALNIDNNGNLHQDLSIDTTDDVVLKIKSPNGKNWGITIDRTGRINVSEVI